MTYLGDCLDGRILSFPLPGLPAPQACVHSIVGNDYIVVPVSLGAGSFCTLSVHTGASVLAFFEQLEQRCGTPRSYRHLLRMGWIVCFINDRAVGDVAAANAFRFADSVRIERTPDLERRESPARLDEVVPARLHHSPAAVIHRPGLAPLPLPTDAPLGDALEAYLHECGLLHTTGSLRQTNPTHSQVGDERHHLVLTSQEAQAALDWMIVDLQHVAHPPLVLYWTAPFRLPFSTPDFAEVLASEFSSLPVVVGSFIADADLELPSAIQQAPFITAIGLPVDDQLCSPGTSSTTTAAPTTLTTTEPLSPPTGGHSEAAVPDTPRPALMGSAGSAASTAALIIAPPGIASAGSSETQLVAVFDTLLHITLRSVPASASLAETVAAVLEASTHLTPPLSFRLLHGRFAWLPTVQIVVWTEPLPGMRVLPIHMGNGELDFCTVSVPVEASAYEAAIQIALACPGHERLRYHIARGSRTLFADGQRTEPFLAWQLATADGGIIADHLTAPNRHFSPQPVSTVIPTHLTEERFATRSHEVIVHRVNRFEAIVAADPSYGPQQLSTRIVSAVNAPGSARLSFPALMPVCNPCRLHVVLHPRQPPTSDMATCLLDMRRVVRAPLALWNVVELPTLCVLTDIQGLLQALYPADLAYGAIYVNYQRVGIHPVGVHRHTVITVLGPGPCEGLDAVYGDGTFGPLCFRGNDVAATRPGLAQFLAYPAHAAGSFFTTSTTTTGGPLLDSGLSQIGVDEDPNCPETVFLDAPWFTVLDTVCGVRVFTGDSAWTDEDVQSQAARMWQASGTCVPRRLAFEINSLPSPQILLCASGEGFGASTVVVDLTPFGGDVCIRVTPSGWSVLDLVASIDTALLAIQPLARLQDATCVCLTNRIITDPRSALDPSAELVQFFLLRVAAPDSCPAHSDTAPVTFAPPTEQRVDTQSLAPLRVPLIAGAARSGMLTDAWRTQSPLPHAEVHTSLPLLFATLCQDSLSRKFLFQGHLRTSVGTLSRWIFDRSRSVSGLLKSDLVLPLADCLRLVVSFLRSWTI